jgi:hypothetical protein
LVEQVSPVQLRWMQMSDSQQYGCCAGRCVQRKPVLLVPPPFPTWFGSGQQERLPLASAVVQTMPAEQSPFDEQEWLPAQLPLMHFQFTGQLPSLEQVELYWQLPVLPPPKLKQ